MAIILYSNALSEELKPSQYTFTDNELINIFPDYEIVRTHRLSEIPNTWCMWGEHLILDKDPIEFHEIGSLIVDEDIFSPLVFIHDTEINLDWNLTDSIIQFNYDNFKRELLRFIDMTVGILIEEKDKMREDSGERVNLIILEQTGISKDKKIIYKFDLSKQTEEFLLPTNFFEFGEKVYTFLKDFYADGDIFVIYADNHLIIELNDAQVKPLINKIMKSYQNLEKYEICSELKLIYDRWEDYKNKKSKPKTKKINKKKLSNQNNTSLDNNG